MLVQGQVGPQVVSDGTETTPRLGKSSEVIVNELHGRYYEQVYRGNVYTASTQAGVALTTTLSATATGFILTNPAASGVNLVILELLFAQTTAPAGIATIGLAASVNPVAVAVVHTTPLTVRKALLGASGTGVGLADSAATLPAVPVAVRAVPGGPVATGGISAPFIKDEIAGALILGPGTAINTFALTTAISGLISMTWEEVTI